MASGHKKTPALLQVLLEAPPEVEYLNLVWRDFRKVVRFIDDNQDWLLPLLGKKPRG